MKGKLDKMDKSGSNWIWRARLVRLGLVKVGYGSGNKATRHPWSLHGVVWNSDIVTLEKVKAPPCLHLLL